MAKDGNREASGLMIKLVELILGGDYLSMSRAAFGVIFHLRVMAAQRIADLGLYLFPVFHKIFVYRFGAKIAAGGEVRKFGAGITALRSGLCVCFVSGYKIRP